MTTYGVSGAPSQNTINYDSILSTSLFNYQRTLTDNISKSNAFFYRIQENGMYEGLDGGVAIQIPLMYALGVMDWYDSYDTLSTEPTDGITSAFFDWRQAAVPISISRKEERQNSSTDRIIDLLKSKISSFYAAGVVVAVDFPPATTTAACSAATPCKTRFAKFAT